MQTKHILLIIVVSVLIIGYKLMDDKQSYSFERTQIANRLSISRLLPNIKLLREHSFILQTHDVLVSYEKQKDVNSKYLESV